MLKSYFKMAFRNFLKHRLFSVINIFGLAFGLASCLLILLFVQHELSYDKWFANSDRIYRVHTKFDLPGRSPLEVVQSPSPLRNAILRDAPEVEEAARLFMPFRPVIKIGEKTYTETVWYAEENFLKIFELPFVEGDRKIALSGNNNIILSEDMALKYFGEKSALDQVINFDNEKDFKVVGVFKNIPENTHFDFDFLVKLDPTQMDLEQWFTTPSYLYLKLKSGMSSGILTFAIGSLVLPGTR